ncbi:MAG TPA: hypothetical protein VL326_22140 [Kofleriaceae bacterium]|jgi:hypothetical protein|nr:hypothetical protein [Kofleriaceae bacterium]
MRWLPLVILCCACDAGQAPSQQRPEQIIEAELAKVPRPPVQPNPPKPVEQPAPPPATPVAPPPASAQDELDALARAVLERYMGKPDTVPDAGLIKGKPLYVKANLGWPCQPDWKDCVEDRRVFTAAALPSPKFHLRTRNQLQAEATKTGEYTHYIDITGVEIKGDQATLSVGVDFMMPENTGGKLCCCSATQIWTKQNGKWTYKKTTSTMCS